MIKDSGERREFNTGAVRDIQEGKGRCDLMPLKVVAKFLDNDVISAIALFTKDYDTQYLYAALQFFVDKYYTDETTVFLEVSKHFEEGAKKYGEFNWQRGIPVNCYIDSAIRHYLKFLRGDTDEAHDKAFVWNVICCIWEVDYHDKDN